MAYKTDTFNTKNSGTTIVSNTSELNFTKNLAATASGSSVSISNEIELTVTVSGGVFVIDGTSQPTLALTKGLRYKFDLSSASLSGHPLRLSTTSDGTHNSGVEYTTGVLTSGTAGNSGAYLQLDLTQSTNDVLYYYCSNHSGMGGAAHSGSVGTTVAENSVTAGSYTNADVTVNAQGIITAVSNGSSGSGGSQNVFSTVAVSGQSDVVADSTTDTLTFAAGSNMTITTDASTDTITFAAASGGGSSSDTYTSNITAYFTSNLNGGYYYYTNQMGQMGGALHGTATLSGFPVSGNFTGFTLHRYAANLVVPESCTLTGYHLVGAKDAGGSSNAVYHNNATLKIWKASAPSTSLGASADSDTSTPTVTQLASIEIDVDGDKLFNFSGTLSSGNSLSAGEAVFITAERSDSSLSVYADHYFSLTLLFQPS